MPSLLPDDPDSWTDEQWIEWLEEVDAETDPEPEGPPQRHRGGMGVQLMGAAMLGLHQAIYGDTDPQVVMVVDADGDDSAPKERLEVTLDEDDYEASTVTVRPWIEDPTDDPTEDDIEDDIDDPAAGRAAPAGEESHATPGPSDNSAQPTDQARQDG